MKGAICGFAGATVFYFLGGALACAIPGLNLGILAGATIGFGVGQVVKYGLDAGFTAIGW